MAEKILVVDDENMALKLADKVLSSAGYRVTCCKNGLDAIDLLRHEKFDLVVLDISMPAISGTDTLSKIRTTEGMEETKAVFMTSSRAQGDVIEALRLGAIDFIPKPIVPEDMIMRVEKAMAKVQKDTILAVDDDPITVQMLKMLLEIRYNVITVTSGRDALLYLEKNRPDIVLMDLLMPEMNGLETMQRMREIEGCQHIPVVFLTSDKSNESFDMIFNAGAMDCLQKPIVESVAITRINRVLNTKRYQDSLRNEVGRKEEQLANSAKKIKKLSNQLAVMLMDVIEKIMPGSIVHSEHAARIAKLLAERLGKTPAEVDDAYYAALLHNIGKIGIPFEILKKTDRLSAEENEIMKTHTTIGAELLDEISLLPALSKAAHWHHENYDGTGFPDGLKGEEIPEVARIVCVASAYAEMSGKTSFRDPLPQKMIKNEFLTNTGRKYDPHMADIMINIIECDTNYDLREKDE